VLTQALAPVDGTASTAGTGRFVRECIWRQRQLRQAKDLRGRRVEPHLHSRAADRQHRAAHLRLARPRPAPLQLRQQRGALLAALRLQRCEHRPAASQLHALARTRRHPAASCEGAS
jgi:hypothetical protein